MKIAEGTARRLISHFDVKKRAYYGTTSMEAEMSLLMANQAQSAPSKLIYDPFVGTGSMLYVRESPREWALSMVFGASGFTELGAAFV